MCIVRAKLSWPSGPPRPIAWCWMRAAAPVANAVETEEPAPGLFHRAGGLFWFERPEDPRDPWRRHDVSRRTRGMFDAFVPRDVDGDGLVDLIGTRGNSGALDGLFWLQQVRPQTPRPRFTSAHESDSRQLPPPPAWVRWLAQLALS